MPVKACHSKNWGKRKEAKEKGRHAKLKMQDGLEYSLDSDRTILASRKVSKPWRFRERRSNEREEAPRRNAR